MYYYIINLKTNFGKKELKQMKITDKTQVIIGLTILIITVIAGFISLLYVIELLTSKF